MPSEHSYFRCLFVTSSLIETASSRSWPTLAFLPTMSSTSGIPATMRSVPGYATNTRYDFTTCPVAEAFRWGSYYETHSAYSLGILQGYIRRMLDAEEGCPRCARRRWDFILQDSYWSRYMTWHICRGSSYNEERLQKFLRGCIETAQDGCDLWEHIRLLRPTCCAWRSSSQEESLETSTSSPRWSSSTTSSDSGSTVDSGTQTDLFPSRDTSPEREVIPEPFFFSPSSPTKSDLVLFQPSTINKLPSNNDWFSRLRKIFGFYWHKFIYRPFVSLYRWFRDTQAKRLCHRLGSLVGAIPPIFHSFAPTKGQSNPQNLLEWSRPSSLPTTPYAHSVVSDDDNRSETTEDQNSPSRMGKTREEVKDMWWKVMAKILLAEHRERRERPSVASFTESTSRPYSPISSVSPSRTESSLRAEDCFSPFCSNNVHSKDNGEDRESTQAVTSDPSNSEFDDQWYAEWFSQWVLESSRKLRSPESESRFSSYSPLSSRATSPAASIAGSYRHEDDTYTLTRPTTPTPSSSPTVGARGRGRYRCSSVSGSSSGSSVSPTWRNYNILSGFSPVSDYYCPRRSRSPSPAVTNRSRSPSSTKYRGKTPSPLNIDHFPLPPSNLSSVFSTATSTSSSRPFSRSPSRSSRCPSRSPTRPSSHLASRYILRSHSQPSSRTSSRPPSPSPSPTSPLQAPAQDAFELPALTTRPRPGPRPTNAKTEDYLPNAHLLRFPATVSARLMMTAETLGVDEVGKRKLVSQLQRTPSYPNSTASSAPTETVLESGVEVRDWKGERRKCEEVKGFDWGFGMGREERSEKEGYGTD